MLLVITAITGEVRAEDFAYINELFDIRNEMTEQGKSIPGSIKLAYGKDLRTLERIFELNTSALTTVEAYFRIFKIALSQEEGISSGSIQIMNEWLVFIEKQCQYDLEYLEEAKIETTNGMTETQIALTQKNIKKLANIVQKGIAQNELMMKVE